MAILQKTGITGSLSISSSGIRPTTSASLFNVNGYNGRLLSVVDTLSGSLFSVNSIAGLPILEVFSNNRVVAGKYAANDFVISGSRVGIGTSSPSAKLAVAGAGTGLMLVGNSGFTGNFTAITLNNGTATTSYNLLSSPTDTTLYINRPSGGNINFREANSDQMTLLSGGLLGIGTTAPSYLLDIYKTTNDSIARIRTTTAGAYLYLDSATDGYFGTAMFSGGTAKWFLGSYGSTPDFTIKRGDAATGTELVRVKTNGNVGIGTDSPSALLNIRASAPTSTGTVTTGTNLLIDSNTSNYITFRNTGDNATYAGLTFLDNNTGGYVVFRNYASNDVIAGSDCMIYGTYQDHIFQNGTSETINGKIETLRIKQNGSVGIGANSPSAKLHISSSTTTALRIETKVGSGTDTQIEYVGPDTHSYALGIDNSDGNKFKISYAASRTPPNLGTNDRFVIQTDGKIGIGSTAPEADLSIVDMNLGRVTISSTTYYGVWLTGGTSATDYSFLSSPSDTNLYVNAPSTKGIYNQINNINRFIITTDFVRINNDPNGANNNIFQRWSYVSTDSYYLDLKQTVTAGVVRYNFSMVNNGTAYNDILILDRGNVGIGSTSPAYKLDVTGTAAISGDVGIGGLIDTGARLYVQGESLTEPFLSVQTCLGNNSTLTATYNTLKGYLAVKIGNNVGSGTALITAGTYYLRLWGT